MFEKSMKVRRAIVGDAYIDRAMQGGLSEFSWPSQQLVSLFQPINEHRSLSTAGAKYGQGQDLTESREAYWVWFQNHSSYRRHFNKRG